MVKANRAYFSLGALLLLLNPVLALAAVCDVDSNGNIDIIDLTKIRLARNTLAFFQDPRDADSDGAITTLDLKVCEQKCKKPNCSLLDPQLDHDRDKIDNAADNCLTIFNPDQSDGDGDGTGDACEIIGDTTITNLIANQVIRSSYTNIVGTFIGPPGSRVAVNRRSACVYNNQFVINNIPVNEGDDIIAVQLFPPVGVGRSSLIKINRIGKSLFSVDANTNCAVAPFDARFDIRDIDPRIRQIEIDYDSDGLTDDNITDLSNPIFTNTYTKPGIYQIDITGIEYDGSSNSQSLSIIVQDGAAIDTEIQASWQNIITGLSTNNIAQALNELTPGAQKTYARVFKALQGKLPAILKTFSSLQVVDINPDYAEYAVNRPINGENRLFLIYFVKDNNGDWKLEGM